MLESLFNKVGGLQETLTLLFNFNFPKQRLQHRGFPVNIEKFYYEDHLRMAASEVKKV